MAVIVRTELMHLRLDAELTQKELAVRIGVDPSMVLLWERGRRPIPPARAGAIGRVLHTSEAAIRLASTTVWDSPGWAVNTIADTRPQPQTATERLEGAGMTARRVWRPGVRLFCLLCGRGSGRDGQILWQRAEEVRLHDPRRRMCRWCGGLMLLEPDVLVGERSLTQVAQQVGELERAA